jgi:NTE family protein
VHTNSNRLANTNPSSQSAEQPRGPSDSVTNTGIAGPPSAGGPRAVQRALVLGAGGVTGIAWATGIVAGLAREGVEVSHADRLIGTSAGSVVAAQLACGATPALLLAAQLDPPTDSKEQSRPYSQDAADARSRQLLTKVGGDVNAARRVIGSMALGGSTAPAHERRAIMEARLPQAQWPERGLTVVAVDADDGTYSAFDRKSGVDFIDAIAASCAVPGTWPVVTIGGRRYMDGGVRSLTNADLAVGAERVLVLAPLGYSETNPVCGHLRSEVRQLEGAGASVTVIIPDSSSLAAIGDNVLDAARAPASARAGLEQGLALGASLVAFW